MAVDSHFQGFDTAPAGGNQRDYRASKAGGQRVDIDADVLFFRDIEHIQRDHAGDAELQQLQRQIEVTLQIGRIDHVYQHVGVAAENIVAGNLLIQRGLRGDGGQGIGARKVYQRDLMIGGVEATLFALNGHPRPVPDTLARAGELVKQRCFPGIWITN